MLWIVEVSQDWVKSSLTSSSPIPQTPSSVPYPDPMVSTAASVAAAAAAPSASAAAVAAST